MKCNAGLLICNPRLFELGIDWAFSRCKRNNSMMTCNDFRARRKNSRTRRNSYRSSLLGIGVMLTPCCLPRHHGDYVIRILAILFFLSISDEQHSQLTFFFCSCACRCKTLHMKGIFDAEIARSAKFVHVSELLS
jgi:hypothetical protein